MDTTSNNKPKVVILGWSGGAGMAIVRAILPHSEQFHSITLLGRRKVEDVQEFIGSGSTRWNQVVVDFDNLSKHEKYFSGFDIAFYAIGTKVGLILPNAEFHRIEFDQATKIAKLLRQGGCTQLHWVSGQGTGKYSPFYFGRIKAQVEEEVRKLEFPRLVIYRPGALICRDGRGLLHEPWVTIYHTLSLVWNWIAVDADVMGRFIARNSLKNEKNEKGTIIVEEYSNTQILRGEL